MGLAQDAQRRRQLARVANAAALVDQLELLTGIVEGLQLEAGNDPAGSLGALGDIRHRCLPDVELVEMHQLGLPGGSGQGKGHHEGPRRMHHGQARGMTVGG